MVLLHQNAVEIVGEVNYTGINYVFIFVSITFNSLLYVIVYLFLLKVY
jgi:hypothetical protein